MRAPLLVLCIAVPAALVFAEGARDQRYGIAQEKKPVTSRIAELCDSWTDARRGACKQYTQELKQKYNMGDQPFPLLEERKGTEVSYRLALSDTKAKQNEVLVVCEKGTVQDPYRLTGIDDVSVEEPKEKLLSEDKTSLPGGNLGPTVPVKKKSAQKKQAYVLLADGESDVTGKKGCMLERDVEKRFGKGCLRPKGESKDKEDPKTCLSGLTLLKGVPFSEEAVQAIKGQGIGCFKEQKGKVQKNKKTQVAEKISLGSYVFCSDDADKLKEATQTDRSKKDGNPDSDAVESPSEADVAQPTAPQSASSLHREKVGVLMKEFQKHEVDDAKVLKKIFDESKQFGVAFLTEGTKAQIEKRIRDFKEQIQRGPETRAHTAALYGGLCGLGELKYCAVKIRGAK